MKKLTKILSVAALFAVMNLNAAQVNVGWLVPTNTAYVTGYEVMTLPTTNGVFNATNSNMTLRATVTGASVTNAIINNVGDGLFRVSVRAYASSGTKSDFISEASTNILNIPSAPTVVRILAVDAHN